MRRRTTVETTRARKRTAHACSMVDRSSVVRVRQFLFARVPSSWSLTQLVSSCCQWDQAMKKHESTTGEKAAKELHARSVFTRSSMSRSCSGQSRWNQSLTP